MFALICFDERKFIFTTSKLASVSLILLKGIKGSLKSTLKNMECVRFKRCEWVREFGLGCVSGISSRLPVGASVGSMVGSSHNIKLNAINEELIGLTHEKEELLRKLHIFSYFFAQITPTCNILNDLHFLFQNLL